MDFYDFLKKLGEIDGIVTAIITSIFTFLITKYTYHKNIPIDKLEIAYNRVYYPLYHLIESCNSSDIIIEKSKLYINRYAKYVDRSTLRAFQYLQDNSTTNNKKRAYSNYKSNIYSMELKLRRRLGYMASNIFTMYTYSNPTDKRIVRLMLEVLGIYLPTIGLPYIKSEKGIQVLALISLLFIVIFIGECGWVAIRFIIKEAIKILLMIKKGISKLWSIIKRKMQSNNEE